MILIRLSQQKLFLCLPGLVPLQLLDDIGRNWQGPP